MKRNFRIFPIILWLFGVITFILAITILLVSSQNKANIFPENFEKNIDLSLDWSLSVKGESDAVSVDIDSISKSYNGKAIVLSKTIPLDIAEGDVLFVETERLVVTAYIGGEEREIGRILKNRSFGVSYAGNWFLIYLSPDDAGKTLDLNVENYNSGRGIKYVSLSTEAYVLNTEARKSIPFFVLFCLLVVAAIISLVVSLYLRNKNNVLSSNTLISLSILLFFCSFWVVLDSNIFLLFGVFSDLSFFLSFYSFMAIPISFLFYEKCSFPSANKMINIFLALFLIASSVVSVLQLLGVALTKTIVIMHILILICVISLISKSVAEKIKNKNYEITYSVIAKLSLMFFSIVAIVLYYVRSPISYSAVISLGILLFAIINIIGRTRRVVIDITKVNSFEELSKRLPCGIFRLRFDNELKIIYANDFFYRQYGIDRVGCDGEIYELDNFSQIISESSRNKLKNSFLECVENGKKDFEVEISEQDKNKNPLFMLLRCDILNDNEAVCVQLNVTARRLMEDKLRMSLEENEMAIKQSGKGVVGYDVQTDTLCLNARAASVFGTKTEVNDFPLSVDSKLFGADSYHMLGEFMDKMKNGEKNGSLIICLYVVNELRWYKCDFTLIFDINGRPFRSVITYEDITKNREKDAAYERWRQMISSMSADKFTLFEINYARRSCENVEGKLLSDKFVLKSEDFFENAENFIQQYVYSKEQRFLREMFDSDNIENNFKEGKFKREVDFRVVEGEKQRWLHLSVQVVSYFNSYLKIYLLFTDINDKKIVELRTKKRSMYDSLTGALNREEFVENVEKILSVSDGKQYMLVMLDIDDYKRVNDYLGHIRGDEVLKEVVAKLNAEAEDGLICRFGGDEFMLLLKADKISVYSKLKRINDSLRMSLENNLNVSVSLGAVMFKRGNVSFGELYKRADEALYTSKHNGKDRFTVV